MNASPPPSLLRRMRGFSLVELMVTLAILAALAFTASAVLGPAVDTTRQQVTQYGMREVSNAIMHFHQDTGFWPRTGPYLPQGSGTKQPILGDACPLEVLNSPANLCQLFYFPSDLDSSWKWNPDTRRGWHGPYLSGFTLLWVNVSATYPVDSTGIAGNTPPTTATAVPVPGVGDSFVSRPQPNLTEGPFLIWVDANSNPNPNPSHKIVTGVKAASPGNPLLFFPPGVATSSSSLAALESEGCNTITNSATSIITNAPCLVSLGPDGIYGKDSTGRSDDDVFNF